MLVAYIKKNVTLQDKIELNLITNKKIKKDEKNLFHFGSTLL